MLHHKEYFWQSIQKSRTVSGCFYSPKRVSEKDLTRILVG